MDVETKDRLKFIPTVTLKLEPEEIKKLVLMPQIKVTRLLSFSSEDTPAYPADNLVSLEGAKKWRCAKEGEEKATAVLQLDEPSVISTVHIGNFGSAFVELQVSRGGSQQFSTLLPSSSFMSPIESRNRENANRVRMFNAEQLNGEVAKHKWDAVKVVCTQPFNRHCKFGLSFLSLASTATTSSVKTTTEKSKQSTSSPSKKLGAFTLRSEEELSSNLGGGLSRSRLFGGRINGAASNNSVAADLKSEATLASIALGRNDEAKNGGGNKDDRPTFYQLKKKAKPEEGAKKRKRSLEDNNKKLPRRDILPGEPTPSTPEPEPKRKRPTSSDAAPPTKQKKTEKQTKTATPKEPRTKPFAKLMEDVVMAISGYQNPLRGNIRQAALDMGARYRPDWDSSCTHLICAFANTPKFNQVRRAGGRIVKREWIEQCSRDRKRYPWRRYCLDSADKGRESEEEIWETKPLPVASASRDTEEEDEEMDTDDELQAVTATKKDPKFSAKNGDEEDSDEAYGADTDVDDPDDDGANDFDLASLPKLPEFFRDKNFFLFGDFPPQSLKRLTRLIVAAGGAVSQYMGPGVDLVVTDRVCPAADFDEATRANPDVIIVTPDYVYASWQSKSLLKTKKFLVKL